MAVVNVPMACHAHLDVETGKVTKVVFLPLEGNAGYFGPQSEVIEPSEGEDLSARAIWESFDWSILSSLPDGIEWEG